jgi:hypothetical protein
MADDKIGIFKGISAFQAVLNLGALALVALNYYGEHSDDKPNPYNDGALSMPAILLMMAVPLLGAKVAKSIYGITKSQDEHDTMTLLRHTGSALCLMGASIVLGLLEADDSLKGSNKDDKLLLAWLYWAILVLDRLMDVLLDHYKILGLKILNPLVSGLRITDYPKNKDDVVAPKQRMMRAVIVVVMLALNLVGIIFTRVDNDGHKGVGGNDVLNIIAMVALGLHFIFAGAVVAAIATKNSQIEIIAINENPLYRSVVAGFVIVAIGMDFGHLWGLNEEPTWFVFAFLTGS